MNIIYWQSNYWKKHVSTTSVGERWYLVETEATKVLRECAAQRKRCCIRCGGGLAASAGVTSCHLDEARMSDIQAGLGSMIDPLMA